MELKRAVKENEVFVSAADDHIMNNLMDHEETVTTKT